MCWLFLIRQLIFIAGNVKMNKKFLGIEIGGTKIQVFLTDQKINILERHKFYVGHKKEAAGIRDAISEKVLEIIGREQILTIGIGFGGPIDYRSGTVIKSHHVEGWSGFHLTKWLSDLTASPVVADNDANIAALGEAHFGAGRNHGRVFYITLGSGIGGGLVIDGEIYHGHRSTEMEIGHIRLDKSGKILENKCSGWAVDQKIRSYIARNPDSILAGLAGRAGSGESRYLLRAIAKGDQGAIEIFNETTDDLAFGISHAVHLVNPGVIILGGGLSLAGPPLRKAVREKISGYVMEAIPLPRICLAELKEDAVCVGAALLAKTHYEQFEQIK